MYQEEHLRDITRRLEKIERLLLRLLELLLELLTPKPEIAVSAKGELNMLVVLAGQIGILFTFTEFDQNGQPIKPLGPITFTSDNPSVATVDSTQQQLSADGLSVTVPVVAVAANADGSTGIANISGLDPTTANQIKASDELDVTAIPPPPPPPPVATSAKGVLSVAAPVASAATKNPLALS